MDEKTAKQMAKMTEAVQPYCDDQIIVAMTCSRAGSLSSVLTGKLMEIAGGIGPGTVSGTLPQPVFIAVGTHTVYAFKYAPKGWKFKIKQEVARWPKDTVRVVAERGRMVTTFVLNTDSGESHALEITTAMGGQPLADAFLAALGVQDY